MAFLSYQELARRGQLLEKVIAQRAVVSPSNKTVFVSYSSKDAGQIGGVISFLRDFGADPYIDSADDSLPKVTSPETADVLRQRIAECPRFVVVVSASSYASRWIPWELGLAHGGKGVAKVAVLPISDAGQEQPWARQEYLGLYSLIRKGDLKGYDEPVWMVHDEGKDTAFTLTQWLKVS